MFLRNIYYAISRKDIWEYRLNVQVLCSQRPSVLQLTLAIIAIVGKLHLLLLLLVVCVALHVAFPLLTTLQHPDVLHLPCESINKTQRGPASLLHTIIDTYYLVQATWSYTITTTVPCFLLDWYRT